MNPPDLATVAPDPQLTLREFHHFEASGEHFVYLVPSAGVFRIDAPSSAILEELEEPLVNADV